MNIYFAFLILVFSHYPITIAGTQVKLIAGTGADSTSGDEGMATSTSLRGPRGIWGNSLGTIYISDTNGNTVRVWNPFSKIISLFAGSGTSLGDNEQATSSQLNAPRGLFGDRNNRLFVCDANANRLRLISLVSNIITTYAFNGESGSLGDDGPATSAQVNGMRSAWLDTNGIIYVADTVSHRLRKIESSGSFYVRALASVSGVASTDPLLANGDFGSATSATLSSPWQIWCDSMNQLFVADFGNFKVRKINLNSPVNTITTFAGTGVAILPESNSTGTATLKEKTRVIARQYAFI